MPRHPQLQALEEPLVDFSAAHFFGVTVRELLREQRSAARAIGGRFGFVVGNGEWVVDLDNGRVRGDAFASAVQDDDALDAVMQLSEEAFAKAVRAGGGLGDAQLHETRPGALGPLLRFLGGALR